MNDNDRKVITYSPEFKEQIDNFKNEWYQHYRDIGSEETPQVDGTGKKIINKKGNTGYDYIEESYMRDMLDKHFPGWSWEVAAPLHFLGSEWVVAQGQLVVIDYHLIEFGVNPPVRKFYGVDSVRIQYGKDKSHTPENIVDVGDNCKQANTSALKYAINRLCRIGDDVYGKRLEMQGAGSFETILETSGGLATFSKLIKDFNILPSRACEMLEVDSLTDILDYNEAWNKIKELKGIKT